MKTTYLEESDCPGDMLADIRVCADQDLVGIRFLRAVSFLFYHSARCMQPYIFVIVRGDCWWGRSVRGRNCTRASARSGGRITRRGGFTRYRRDTRCGSWVASITSNIDKAHQAVSQGSARASYEASTAW